MRYALLPSLQRRKSLMLLAFLPSVLLFLARLRLPAPQILPQRLRQPFFPFLVILAHGRSNSDFLRFWASRLDKPGPLWP